MPPAPMTSLLEIPEALIRRNERNGMVTRYVNQKLAERRLKRRALRFRSTNETENQQAYGAMSAREFETINACQEWANWRVIPRMINGLVPDRPLFVVDLGCGSGGSTAILATYCPAGSAFLGLDASTSLIQIARERTLTHASGSRVPASFEVQAIHPPLRREGVPLPDSSVDLVHSSGILGHHFHRLTAPAVIDEVDRLVAPSGLAVLDSGPTLKASELVPLLYARGFRLARRRKSWALDRNRHLAFVRR